MPKVVDQLSAEEKNIEAQLRQQFSEDQMCAYFLTKTVRSLYQFDDDFIAGWYREMFDQPPAPGVNTRNELVQAYTRILMVERKYRYILDYWLRQYQAGLLDEMQAFFGGEPGK